MSLIQDIREYRRVDLPRLHQEVEYYKNGLSSLVAIQQAALGHTPIGEKIKVNPHQRRPPKESKPLAMLELTTIKDKLLDIKSFELLYETIEQVEGDVTGVGSLWSYDTAQRIGWHLNLYPSKVFIHAGAKEGVVTLIERYNLDIKKLGRYLPLSALPEELHSLAPFEVENFLCIWNKTH